MFAIQGEYRLELTKRIMAPSRSRALARSSPPSVNAIDFHDLLPSAGAGFRYVLAEKNHVALRLDAALGPRRHPVFI